MLRYDDTQGASLVLTRAWLRKPDLSRPPVRNSVCFLWSYLGVISTEIFSTGGSLETTIVFSRDIFRGAYHNDRDNLGADLSRWRTRRRYGPARRRCG